MKNSVFSKVFARHIPSLLLVGYFAIGVSNMAAAADISDQQSKDSCGPKATTVVKHDSGRPDLWERNLRLDGDQFLEAQVYWGHTCYINPAWSCPMTTAGPVGAACWCPSIYGPIAGSVVLP